MIDIKGVFLNGHVSLMRMGLGGPYGNSRKLASGSL